MTAPHLVKRRAERALRERGASKAAATTTASVAWRRYGWIGRVAPAAFVWLACREVRRG